MVTSQHALLAAAQIDRDNFSKLRSPGVNTAFLGLAGQSSRDPLMIGGVLYTTAGTRRAVVALGPTPARDGMPPRTRDRALETRRATERAGAWSYWSDSSGSDGRIIYVTPGYRMIALDAWTASLCDLGRNGVVDLKWRNDQDVDLVTAELGLMPPPRCRRRSGGGSRAPAGVAHEDMQMPGDTCVASTPGPERLGFSTPSRIRASSATTPGRVEGR